MATEDLCKSIGGKCKSQCSNNEFDASKCTRDTFCCVNKPSIIKMKKTQVFDVEHEAAEESSITGWVIVGAIVVGVGAYLILKPKGETS